ncbi:MAG TPA: HAD family phosphatase [Solirubrobacterales bacterium]|nr:HAD family phosphatase [Solirubrobacterales bacterium]
MSAPRPTALLVDFGGVLTTNIWESFRAFSAREGLDPDTIKDHFRGDADGIRLLRQLETGALADAEFEQRFGALLGVPPENLIDRLFAGLGPDERMISAVAAVKESGAPTGLISNSWGTGIYERAPLHVFDATVISGDVGLHKPQPEIYELGAERLGVAVGACAFVDDLRENIAGAEAVGMHGILHRDTEATLAQLGELFGLELGVS